MPVVKVNKFSRSKVPVMDTIPEHSEPVDAEKPYEADTESISNDPDEFGDVEDLFSDLNNENYVSEEVDVKKSKSEKEKIKLEKEQLKLDIARAKEEERKQKLLEKEMNKVPKVAKTKILQTEDDLFSSTPTELLGLDKRQLLKRISEYKSLFPEQLKSFKIKKNPTLEDLQLVISEMDAIVSTDTVEAFCTDAVLGVVGLAENISTRGRFNITGTAEMLRQQPKFHQLCKQLYIKHKVFSNVPPEMQLIMMIGMTAMVAGQNNAKREKISNFLNQPVKN